MTTTSRAEATIKWLARAAAEIRAGGHNGWGNVCDDATCVMLDLLAENKRLRAAQFAMPKSVPLTAEEKFVKGDAP